MAETPFKVDISGNETPQDFETLRGSNGTLQLAGLIEQSTQFSGGESTGGGFRGSTVLQTAIMDLQEWAGRVDNQVIVAASTRDPNSEDSLKEMMEDLISSEVATNRLNYLDLFRFAGKKRLARQDQWGMAQALFGIDTRALGAGSAGGLAISGGAELQKVHDYMFQLIAAAAKKRGQEVEEISLSEGAGREVRIIKSPTIVEGIRATIKVENFGFGNAWGYPNIVGTTLMFDPLFLASVKPLNREEIRKYWPEAESSRTRFNKQKNFQRSQGEVDPRDPRGYYRVLGVNSDTDPEDIEEVLLSAYRRLAKKYHSDVAENTEANRRKMVELNIAYEFLRSTQNRRDYGT